MKYFVFGGLLLVVMAMGISAAWRLSDGLAESWRISAVSDAADAAQYREIRATAAAQKYRIQQDQHNLEMAEKQATEPYRIAAIQNAWYWISWFAIFAGSVSILALAISGSWWMIGTSRARVIQAKVNAQTIQLDRVTRQYPLLPYEINGTVRIFNPNNGQIVWLSDKQEPIPQMITASAATQLAGAIAEKAAQAKNGEAIASIIPPLVIEQ